MPPKNKPASMGERFPHLLAYPFRGGMLWMMAALTLLRLLNHLPSLLGLLFELVFWLMAFKLAVEALTNTAHGRDDPLGLGEVAATDGEAFKQIVLQVLAVVALVVAVAVAGKTGGWIALGVLALMMPAAIMLLAMNDSLLSALNPLNWFELIGRVGLSYFVVVAVFAGLVYTSAVVEATLHQKFPIGGGLLASFVAVYSLVVSYHVLGDLIFRHQESLGLDTTPAVVRATYANPLEDDTMQTAEACAADGRPGDAATVLQDLFRGRGASDPVHERYRDFLIAAGDVARLSKHDREYVNSLLVTDKHKRALAIYVDTLARDPDFRIDHDEAVAQLVLQAMRTGQTRLGVQLAQDFEERFPGSLQAPMVLHAVAWAMADKFDMGQAAFLRLQRVLRTHPQHPLADKLHELMLQIDRLPKVGADAPR